MDVLRSPYYHDVPRAFKIKLPEGKEELVGAYGRLIELFAKYMNYTLELVNEDDFLMSKLQEKIENNLYNISMLTSSHKNRLANIDFSYPLDMSKTCVMVPAEDELPRFWYVVWPFGRYIWSFLVISILYVAFVMTYLNHPTNSYRNNLLHSMALIIYSPNATLRLMNIPLRLQLFYTLVLVMGFIMSSYYGSFLASYNVKPLFQPYINSIDDAMAAKIKILISPNTLEELKNNNYVNVLPLAELLQECDQLVRAITIDAPSRSYAYVLSTVHWNLIARLQKNLIQPIYQLSNICFGHNFNTYPMQVNSKFARSLQIFILRCRESGLWEYWQEEAFIKILNRKIIENLTDDYPVDPLTMSYYRIAWILYIGGVIVSSITFAIEIVSFKYKLRITCIKKTISAEV